MLMLKHNKNLMFCREINCCGVIHVIDDSLQSRYPDSIFPNTDYHENADVALYPMFAENRRAERRKIP
jgi:hypothetical protein